MLFMRSYLNNCIVFVLSLSLLSLVNANPLAEQDNQVGQVTTAAAQASSGSLTVTDVQAANVKSVTINKESESINFLEILTIDWVLVLKVFLLVFAVMLINYILKKVYDRLLVRFEATDNKWDDSFIFAVRKPSRLFVWVYGLQLILTIILSVEQTIKYKEILNSFDAFFIVIIAWFLVRFINKAEQVLQDPARNQDPLDPTTLSAVGKLLRASIIITAVLMTMSKMGIPIGGVVAFDGVGGIAVGFAAKDLLANFFGGLMIYMDRPFKVGDWISSPDKQIEGTVEYIGWRLTRVRKFDKRPLYIPNSTFMNISVENPSRMTNRRIYDHIGVRYDDMQQVEKIVDDIKSMLKANSEIDLKQTLIVNVSQFGPSSIDIMIYTFTKTKNWVQFHAIKQDVYMQIGHIIHSHNADFAFPTQTLHLQSPLSVEQTSEKFK